MQQMLLRCRSGVANGKSSSPDFAEVLARANTSLFIFVALSAKAASRDCFESDDSTRSDRESIFERALFRQEKAGFRIFVSLAVGKATSWADIEDSRLARALQDLKQRILGWQVRFFG